MASCPRQAHRRAEAVKSPTKWPYEDSEQAMLCQILDRHHIRYHASLNGAHLRGNKAQRAAQWAKLKNQGAKTGVPDLVIVSPPKRGDIRGPVFVEMKRVKAANPSISKEQRAYHKLLRGLGYTVVIGYGMVDAWEQLQALGYG